MTTSARPGRPPKKSRRDGRQALLAAARELIREEGIERVTLRAVASRAGVGSGLVNYHFGNKEGLKEAVVEAEVADLRERILVEEIKGRSAEEELRAIIIRMIRGLGEQPHVARMVVELVLAGDERILRKLVANVALPNLEILNDLLRRGQKEGAFRRVQVELVAPAAMGAGVYPLVAAPLLKAMTGLDLTRTDHLRRYAAHTADLLIDGLHASS